MTQPNADERPRVDPSVSGSVPRADQDATGGLTSGGLTSGGAAPTARPASATRQAPQRAAVPAEILARLEQARTLFRSLETATHYTVLGVARSAGTEQIRNAFRQLAGLFHSDRYARFALTDADRAVVQKVFIAVNKASETLSDTERRREYDLSLDAGIKPGTTASAANQIDQVFKAEKLVRDAVMLLRNNQGQAALEKADEALAITPKDPLAQAARHFADFLVVQARGAAPQMAARSRDALRAITQEFQARDEPFVYLGRVHRQLGENEAAISAFEQALKANPRCAEAASELRFLQRHTTKSEPTRGGDSGRAGGLFGLRKK
jgi:curved DNA-binding protein CbpA